MYASETFMSPAQEITDSVISVVYLSSGGTGPPRHMRKHRFCYVVLQSQKFLVLIERPEEQPCKGEP